jgi:hypothetical protein
VRGVSCSHHPLAQAEFFWDVMGSALSSDELGVLLRPVIPAPRLHDRVLYGPPTAVPTRCLSSLGSSRRPFQRIAIHSSTNGSPFPSSRPLYFAPYSDIARQWEADREAAACWATGRKLRKARNRGSNYVPSRSRSAISELLGMCLLTIRLPNRLSPNIGHRP